MIIRGQTRDFVEQQDGWNEGSHFLREENKHWDRPGEQRRAWSVHGGWEGGGVLVVVIRDEGQRRMVVSGLVPSPRYTCTLLVCTLHVPRVISHENTFVLSPLEQEGLFTCSCCSS